MPRLPRVKKTLWSCAIPGPAQTVSAKYRYIGTIPREYHVRFTAECVVSSILCSTMCLPTPLPLVWSPLKNYPWQSVSPLGVASIGPI